MQARCGYVQCARECIHAQTEGHEIILFEYFARVDRAHLILRHREQLASVIVEDLYIKRLSVLESVVAASSIVSFGSACLRIAAKRGGHEPAKIASVSRQRKFRIIPERYYARRNMNAGSLAVCRADAADGNRGLNAFAGER